MRKPILLLSLLVPFSTAQASVVWTGVVDSNIFEDGNWDFSGALNGTSEVSPNVVVNDNLVATGASITGTGGNLKLADGASFSLTDSTLTFTGGTTGFSGVDDGAGTARVNPPATLSLNNSSAAMQFVTVGVDVLVDGSSSFQLYGGGDPINSQTELTQILISTGGTLTLNSVGEFNEQGQNILVNGVPFDTNGSAAGGADDGLWDSLGTTRVAVPEPSSALLGSMALLFLLRRKK